VDEVLPPNPPVLVLLVLSVLSVLLELSVLDAEPPLPVISSSPPQAATSEVASAPALKRKFLPNIGAPDCCRG